MKRLAVIAILICSSLQMFASELVVTGRIDVPFSVFINGNKYYSYNNQVRITNLPSGSYGMEIYTEGASYELLYDYRISIPYRSTVNAEFTADNRMYISNSYNKPAVVVNLTPYPRRVHVVNHPVVVHHSTPKVVHHSTPVHKPVAKHSAPVAKAHKSTPAPSHNAKPAPKPAPKAANTVKKASQPRPSAASNVPAKSVAKNSTYSSRPH